MPIRYEGSISRAMADERFQISRCFRKPRRGPANLVQDGWLLTDTLTGSVIRFELKSEIQGRIDRIVREEEAIPREKVVAWDTDLEFRSRTPSVEVYLYDADGQKIGNCAALVERVYAPMRVVEWLKAMGLDHVPRKAR